MGTLPHLRWCGTIFLSYGRDQHQRAALLEAPWRYPTLRAWQCGVRQQAWKGAASSERENLLAWGFNLENKRSMAFPFSTLEWRLYWAPPEAWWWRRSWLLCQFSSGAVAFSRQVVVVCWTWWCGCEGVAYDARMRVVSCTLVSEPCNGGERQLMVSIAWLSELLNEVCAETVCVVSEQWGPTRHRHGLSCQRYQSSILRGVTDSGWRLAALHYLVFLSFAWTP